MNIGDHRRLNIPSSLYTLRLGLGVPVHTQHPSHTRLICAKYKHLRKNAFATAQQKHPTHTTRPRGPAQARRVQSDHNIIKNSHFKLSHASPTPREPANATFLTLQICVLVHGLYLSETQNVSLCVTHFIHICLSSPHTCTRKSISVLEVPYLMD